MALVSRINYYDLPPAVRGRVDAVLLHRKNIRNFTLGYTGLSAGFAGAAKFNEVASSGRPLVTGAKIAGEAALVWGGVGLLALRGHQVTYAKEEAELWRAIRASRDSSLRALCGSFPYLVVDAKGALVGKKRAPRIGFVPIGRRRIPTRVFPKRVGAHLRKQLK